MRFPLILISFGLLLLSIWGIHKYFYNQSMSLSDTILASYAKKNPTDVLPVHITVGKTISLPIVESGKQEGVWAISQTKANHVTSSSVPGSLGNTIIYAHNAPNLFGPLDKAQKGDPIAIRLSDGSLHKYIVTEVSWVTPSHTELLSPANHEVITVYTCGGLLDSLRIVVRAIPV
jgi:LPXTG-site transpeptidase (sortase) family protein